MRRTILMRCISVIWICVLCMMFVCGCAQQGRLFEEQLENSEGKSTSSSKEMEFTVSVYEAVENGEIINSAVESGQSETREHNMGNTIPSDFQRRIDQAEKIEQLELTGLSFEERCQLVMRWQSNSEYFNGRWCGRFGLVELTQDETPEIYAEAYVMGVDCMFYDISGDYVHMVLEFSTDHKGEYNIWHLEDDFLQGENWMIYSTQYTDGTVGGIIETAETLRECNTIYFTIGGKYPLGEHLTESGELGEWNINYREPSDEGLTEDLPPDWRKVVAYDLYQTDETKLFGFKKITGIDEGLFWDYRDMSETEFLISVQDTWLGKLNSLPRDVWISPLVHTAVRWADEGEMLWSQIEEYAQYLMDEYNCQLEEGNYALPPVS